MLCGIEDVPAYDKSVKRNVPFPVKFSTKCRPVVVATLESPNRWRTMLSIAGRGTRNRPDYYGFSYTLKVQLSLPEKDEEPFKWQKVHWMAVGFVDG